MDAEVIVVGGGPGGAVAARALARTGVRVLLLEKARFPRNKPCGGSLSPKVLSLGVDFRAVVEDVVTEAVLAAPGKAPIRHRAEIPLAYMVQRDRFDQLLLTQAAEAGACVLEGHRVLRAQEVTGGVEVVLDQGTFRAPILVAADGAQGAIARSFPRAPSRISLAMDVRLAPPDRVRRAWRGKVLIDFGAIPFGYGWVFPKACELSTGVLGMKEKVRGLPGHLARFLDRQRLRNVSKQVAGWPIPYPAWSLNPIASPRVLLVGDAAGLVDPFTGEGIYYAMRSGLLAATTIAEGGIRVAQRYRQRIRDAFEHDLRGAAVLAACIHRAPRWSFRALRRHPGAVEAFVAVLAGKSSYPAFLQKVARACLADGWKRLTRAA
ncbi:MAG: geranylgeranyl reductase family protein [Candidatus Methylomirabilales bacterium]